MNESSKKRYWRANLKVVVILLAIWFVVAYGLSIFFVESMNQIAVGQLGLGFWMAQQGSIFVFVLLVLIYAWLMDSLDRRYNVND
ncbi:MAG: DUF4212 domain-containing protein [Planctomycetota bacterium]|nr:DUF4212 domain-containing protein [Planctomycetota bacterium]